MAVLAKATGFYLGLIVAEGVIWTEETSSLNESNANETVADRGTVGANVTLSRDSTRIPDRSG